MRHLVTSTLAAAGLTISLLGCTHVASVPASVSRAAAPRATEAETVARAFFDAIGRSDWLAAATLTDPAPIDSLRQQQLRSARDPIPFRVRPEDLMRADSTLTPAMAVERARQFEQQQRNAKPYWQHEFSAIPDTATLATLSAHELTARWLEGQDVRFQMLALVAQSNCKPSVKADFATQVKSEAPRVLIGVVQEDSVAYAVHRENIIRQGPMAYYIVKPLVVVLRRRNGVWRIIPSSAMFSWNSTAGVSCPNK